MMSTFAHSDLLIVLYLCMMKKFIKEEYIILQDKFQRIANVSKKIMMKIDKLNLNIY